MHPNELVYRGTLNIGEGCVPHGPLKKQVKADLLPEMNKYNKIFENVRFCWDNLHAKLFYYLLQICKMKVAQKHEIENLVL